MFFCIGLFAHSAAESVNWCGRELACIEPTSGKSYEFLPKQPAEGFDSTGDGPCWPLEFAERSAMAHRVFTASEPVVSPEPLGLRSL